MAVPTRPVLKPALRQLWRDTATLQLGIGSRRAVVLHGLQSDDAATLALLDGSRDVAAVTREVADAGGDPARAAELVDLLAAADALDEPAAPDARLVPDLLSLSLLHAGPGAAATVVERRRRATVCVTGAGRVGSGIVMLLVAAGIGRVVVDDAGPVRPADLGPAGIPEQGATTRAAAVVQRCRRAGFRSVAAQAAGPSASPAAVTVVAPASAQPPPEMLTAVRRVPHLVAVVRETAAVVGPFVVPGVTACLRCDHLTRSDRDPQWTALSAQLAGSRPVDPCDVVLATMAAALAAMQVLAYVDDPRTRPATAGAALEFDLADGRLRRRSLVPHPSCGCGAAVDGATIDM